MDRYRRKKAPDWKGVRITDVRDQTRCGIVKRITEQGFHVAWRGEGSKWMVAGYARKLIGCSSTTGERFFLTQEQINSAVKVEA